jgi:hypothetical protein
MHVPASELPDIAQIRQWAEEKLPAHFRLLDVRCNYGTTVPSLLPEDWEVTIDYVSTLDASTMGSLTDIDAYHSWADPLIAKIRAEWPASCLRIGITERSTESE